MSPADRTIATFTTDWEGIALSVTYEPCWLSMREPEYTIAHLEVRVLTPERAPLPITDTGYRSHFVDPGEVAEAAGPVAYVLAWLDHAAASPAWQEQLRQERERQLASRQLSLF